jgi:hypothetical protein
MTLDDRMARARAEAPTFVVSSVPRFVAVTVEKACQEFVLVERGVSDTRPAPAGWDTLENHR